MPPIEKPAHRTSAAIGLLMALAISLTGCVTVPSSSRSTGERSSAGENTQVATREPAATPVLQLLADEAEALRPLAQSALAQRFLDEHVRQRRTGAKSLSARAERLMLDYPWPGNVRELKSAIERACLLGAHGALQPEALFEELPAALDTTSETLDEHLKVFERQYILRVLATHEGHGRITRAAATLGISRKNLWERMKRLGIPASGEG